MLQLEPVPTTGNRDAAVWAVTVLAMHMPSAALHSVFMGNFSQILSGYDLSEKGFRRTFVVGLSSVVGAHWLTAGTRPLVRTVSARCDACWHRFCRGFLGA